MPYRRENKKNTKKMVKYKTLIKDLDKQVEYFKDLSNYYYKINYINSLHYGNLKKELMF